jgi:hypothetical protein
MAAKEALPKTPVFFGGKSAAKRRREILDIMVRLGGNTLEELGSEDREYIRGVFGNFDNFNKFRDEMMEKFDKITKEIGELNKIVNMTAQGRNTGGTREWN